MSWCLLYALEDRGLGKWSNGSCPAVPKCWDSTANCQLCKPRLFFVWWRWWCFHVCTVVSQTLGCAQARQVLHRQAASESPCFPSESGSGYLDHGPPASAFSVLGLQACTTMTSSRRVPPMTLKQTCTTHDPQTSTYCPWPSNGHVFPGLKQACMPWLSVINHKNEKGCCVLRELARTCVAHFFLWSICIRVSAIIRFLASSRVTLYCSLKRNRKLQWGQNCGVQRLYFPWPSSLSTHISPQTQIPTNVFFFLKHLLPLIRRNAPTIC